VEIEKQKLTTKVRMRAVDKTLAVLQQQTAISPDPILFKSVTKAGGGRMSTIGRSDGRLS
jgi:hypothetical protein